VAPTCLWERTHAADTNACPFGVCLQPAEGNGFREEFSSWLYQAPFFPPGEGLTVLSRKNDPSEPFVFSLDSVDQSGDVPSDPGEPLEHHTGHHRITDVTVHLFGDAPLSPEFSAVTRAAPFFIHRGGGFLLELMLDQGKKGKHQDLRPGLPLLING
jgi:hypothetical protein